MRITIDTDARTLVESTENGDSREYPLDSRESFRLISKQWLTVGWSQRYSYSFTWLGRPIIQLPEDMIRIQEIIFSLKPDVIIETGVAHGGSLIYYASICKAIGKGRVVGIDVRIHPHNREAIENHILQDRIDLIEGSSIEPATLQAVQEKITSTDRVLVILDSCHTKDHVLSELKLYSPLVSVGSYIIATDGVMGDVAGRPGADPSWVTDNPSEAAIAFAAQADNFCLEEPAFLFNEGQVTERITYWPNAYLRRVA